jgi:hypothetical protein
VQVRGLAYGAEVPVEAPAPLAAAMDGGIVLEAPGAHGFAPHGPARAPQISLSMDGPAARAGRFHLQREGNVDEKQN